jgi:hypothetical protein
MDVRVQHGVCAGMSHRGTAMARRRVRRATILSSAAGLAAPPTPRASSAGLDLWRGTAGSGCTGPGGGACGARRAKHQMRWEDGARPGPIELLPRPPRALHIPLSPILPEQRGGQGAGRRWRAPGQLRESGVWRSCRSWTTTLSTCSPRCAGSGSAPPGRHVAFGVKTSGGDNNPEQHEAPWCRWRRGLLPLPSSGGDGGLHRVALPPPALFSRRPPRRAR